MNNVVCGAVIKTTSGSPTGLKNHLKTIHKIDPTVRNTFFDQENLITKYCGKVTVKNKKTFRASIARLACLSNISLNALAKSKELDYLYRQVFNRKIPSANGIKHCIFQFSAEIKKEMIEEMKELSQIQPFTLSFDEWTSIKMTQMMNLNVHFEKKSFNLGVIEVKEISCTSEAILRLIQQKLQEYGLNLDNPQFIFATADGASANKKLERISNIALQQCQNHGLNLAIVDTFYAEKGPGNATEELSEEDEYTEEEDDEDGNDEVDVLDEDESDDSEDDDDDVEQNFQIDLQYSDTIKKVRKISAYVKNSSKMRRILKKYTDRMPLLDVRTRWSSLAKMLERFRIILPDLRKAFIDASKAFNITNKDAKTITVLSKLLSPVVTTVKRLSSAKANLLTADREITCLINTLIDTEFDFQVPIKQIFIGKIKSRFISRRTEMSNVIQFLLQRKFHPNKNIFYSEPSNDFVKKCFEKFCFKPLTSQPLPADSGIPPAEESDEEIDLEKFKAKATKTELDEEIETLRKNFTLGTNLIDLARVLMSIKATSTDAERTFSICGMINSKLRNRMKTNLLDSIVVVRMFCL